MSTGWIWTVAQKELVGERCSVHISINERSWYITVSRKGEPSFIKIERGDVGNYRGDPRALKAHPDDLEPLAEMLLRAFDAFFAPMPGALSVVQEEERGIVSLIMGKGKGKGKI